MRRLLMGTAWDDIAPEGEADTTRCCVVIAGDTLNGIPKERYGKDGHRPDIREANRDRIK